MRTLLWIALGALLGGCDFRDAYGEWCRESGQCDGGAGPNDGGASPDDGGPTVLDAGSDPGAAVEGLELFLADPTPQLVGATTALELWPLAADGGRLASRDSTLRVNFDGGGALAAYRDGLEVTTGFLTDPFQVGATGADAGGVTWFKLGGGSLSAGLQLRDGGERRSRPVSLALEANASWAGDGRTANVPWMCFDDTVTIAGQAGALVDTTGEVFALTVDGGARLHRGRGCLGVGTLALDVAGGRLERLEYSVRYEGAASIALESSSRSLRVLNRRETRVLNMEAFLLRDGGGVAGCERAALGWRIAADAGPLAGIPLTLLPGDSAPFRVEATGGVQVGGSCPDAGPLLTTTSSTGQLEVFLRFSGAGGTLVVSTHDGGYSTPISIVP